MSNKSMIAKVNNLTNISKVWIIPIIALAIGIWMVAQYINSKGSEITLILNTAEGVEIGKTEIKSLNVKVGVITDVKLSDDYSYIIAKAQINKNATRMLKKDTRFWLVKPRIGKDGISGLDTLLSGAYIELQPGVMKKQNLKFTVLDTPPVASPDAKGLRVILLHNEAGKLTVGDPVLYEGFTVGRVEKVTFNIKTKEANYQLFIFQPYDNLVHTHTKFWLTSGLDLQMSAEGFSLKVGSMESLLTGGVSFRTPKGTDQGALITEQMNKFHLYKNIKTIHERMYDEYVEYVMLFDESVRGLNVGAPVEYRGIRIGTVIKVPLRLPTGKEGFSDEEIPVLIRIELGRIYNQSDSAQLDTLKENLESEFNNGLRSTLKTGNLLTGALFIDTSVYKNEKMPAVKEYHGYPLFPTKVGGFSEIQKQLSSALTKFNNLPVEATLASLNKTLNTSQKTLAAAEKVAKNIDDLLVQKEMKSLPSDLHKTLKDIQSTLSNFSSDSTPYRNLEGALSHFEQVMIELQPVLRQLNEKPDSLVFGADKLQDPVPVGGIQ